MARTTCVRGLAALGGSPLAISSIVMPNDQMSASWPYLRGQITLGFRRIFQWKGTQKMHTEDATDDAGDTLEKVSNGI